MHVLPGGAYFSSQYNSRLQIHPNLAHMHSHTDGMSGTSGPPCSSRPCSDNSMCTYSSALACWMKYKSC